MADLAVLGKGSDSINLSVPVWDTSPEIEPGQIAAEHAAEDAHAEGVLSIS
jgi:hypothetical protein